VTLPVEPGALGAFALTALAIVVAPGPDTLLILRHALASGRAAGLAVVGGIQLGLVIHTGLAAAGLSLLIASSPVLFRGVAAAGAIYLGWLGVASLRAGSFAGPPGRAAATSAGRAFADAVVTNLLNPKVMVLFLALYPSFLDPARARPVVQIATLSAVLIAINVAWQAPLAWAAERAKRSLVRPEMQRAAARLTGAALICLAVVMLYEQLIRKQWP
jgi:threonine/homoserine/homoserine lactone efflux protein